VEAQVHGVLPTGPGRGSDPASPATVLGIRGKARTPLTGSTGPGRATLQMGVRSGSGAPSV